MEKVLVQPSSEQTMASNSVSVVIPTYRREAELRDVVMALLDQADDSTEFIVIDQTTDHEPETVAFLNSVHERVRVVQLSPPGLIRALNAGGAAARRDIVLVLDDDIVPVPNLIESHRAAYLDPSVAMVGGRVVSDLTRVREAPVIGRIDAQANVEYTFSATKPAEAESVPGGNMSFRREVFREVGGVQDGYIGTEVYNETDFSCLIRSRGFRIVYRPDAEIFHLRAPRGGCAQREGSLRTPYSLYHNATLFSLRCMPWRSLPQVLLFRLRQARKDAFAQRRPIYLVMFPVAVTHGFVSWLRTGKKRYPPRPITTSP